MKAERHRSQAGYTLVELLVATAIGAIVIAAVASIVLTTAISTNVATSRVDATTQVRTFQLNAYDDVVLSEVPVASGCGTAANPCTTQPMILTGSRIPNRIAGDPAPYTVTYAWDPSQDIVIRQVSGGPSRTVASDVTSYAWYVDTTAAHPTIVVALTITIKTYNASYSESQSFLFYPRVTS